MIALADLVTQLRERAPVDGKQDGEPARFIMLTVEERDAIADRLARLEALITRLSTLHEHRVWCIGCGHALKPGNVCKSRDECWLRDLLQLRGTL